MVGAHHRTVRPGFIRPEPNIAIRPEPFRGAGSCRWAHMSADTRVNHRSPASVLAGHPTVIELVRVVEAMAAAEAQIVVFGDDRAIIVGALSDEVLQPRTLRDSEVRIVATGVRQASTSAGQSYAIGSPAVGAITIGPDAAPVDPDAMHSLARVCGSLLGTSVEDGSRRERMLENLRDTVLLLKPDLTIDYISRACATLLGLTPDEVAGRSVLDFVHPDDLDAAMEAVARLGTQDELYRVQMRVKHAAGHFARIVITGRDMSDDPELGGILLCLRSGHHDQELQQRLDRARSLNEAMIDQLHDGIIAVDALGATLVVNDAARQLLGLGLTSRVHEIGEDQLRLLDRNGVLTVGDDHVLRQVRAGKTVRNEEYLVLSDGHYRHLVVSATPVRDDLGVQIGGVIGFTDVTEARRAELELRERALHDQLTGLANRRLMHERLADLSGAGPGGPTMVAGLLVDLDNFKQINDTHGHRVGDDIIRAVADRIGDALQPDDLLVRLGGDEFLVLVVDHEPAEAAALADRVRDGLAEPVAVGEHSFSLTCSIGVAWCTPDMIDHDSLLRCADIALYAAKDAGRNRTAVYDDDLAREAAIGAAQREMLRRALEEDALVMHFQPLVDSSTSEIIGFESLARCRDTHGRLVGPGGFLDAVEGSRLVWELDRRGFELTCTALPLIDAVRPGMKMACNFSGLSVLQPDFVDTVLSIVDRHHIDPSQICIEITESAAFEAGVGAQETLRTLHDHGLQLALDDFGTGYSSLSHLRDLPLSTVKVDKSFVAKLGCSGSERSIAQAVVNLANDLGLTVVAEGVETREQLDSARAMGFNVIQGWYYSRARSLAEILDMLTPLPDTSGAPVRSLEPLPSG